MNIWLWAAAVFVIDFVVDFAWSMYIKSLANNKSLKAAGWSAFISLAGGITVISYTENNLLLIPAVIGGAIGTYCSKYFNVSKSE
jgi:hypothetical protein